MGAETRGAAAGSAGAGGERDDRDDDPLGRLARASGDDRTWLSVGLVVAALLHAGTVLGAGAWAPRPSARTPEPSMELAEIDLPKDPPVDVAKPEEPPEPEPAKPAPVPAKVDVPKAEEAPVAKLSAKAEAPAAPAQAAAVLTSATEPNEPVDMTDGFVTGSAATYAGGTTTATGTSTRAVRAAAAATGVVGGSGGAQEKPAASAAPDLSRRPSVAGGGEWRCPFPPEADGEQVDHAVATIRVDIDATGRATSVVVVKESGAGFGREARRCALEKEWTSARDRSGNATSGSTTVNVHFDR